MIPQKIKFQSQLKPFYQKKRNGKKEIKTVIFSEMTTITGLTHFCIRYTKTCQAIYLNIKTIMSLVVFNEQSASRKEEQPWMLPKIYTARH